MHLRHFIWAPNSSELIRGWWFAADLSSQEKEKKGISVKKFPGIKQMEGGLPCKFLIPGDFFAESRQQRSYGSQTAALAYCNGSEVIMLP
jgi:hypothetical protein